MPQGQVYDAPVTVTFPDGTRKTYDPGQTREQIAAQVQADWDELQQATGPRLQSPALAERGTPPPLTTERAADPMTALRGATGISSTNSPVVDEVQSKLRDDPRYSQQSPADLHDPAEFLRDAGQATAFGVGASPMSFVPRLAGVTAGGAMQAAGGGDAGWLAEALGVDNPLVAEPLLEAIAEGGARSIPGIGLVVGALLGAANPFDPQGRAAIAAFLRERARGPVGSGLPYGAPIRTADRIRQAASAQSSFDDAISATGRTVPATDLYGGAKNLYEGGTSGPGLRDRAAEAEDLYQAARGREENVIANQISTATGGGRSTDDILKEIDNWETMDDMLGTEIPYKQVVGASQDMASESSRIYDAIETARREAGQVRQGGGAGEDLPAAQRARAISEQLKKAFMDRLTPTEQATRKPLTDRIADLHKMYDFSRNMWGGGGLTTRGGFMRAALMGGAGSGLGAAVAPRNAAAIGALAFGATPANAARAGFAGGRMAQAAPTTARVATIRGRNNQSDEDERRSRLDAALLQALRSR